MPDKTAFDAETYLKEMNKIAGIPIQTEWESMIEFHLETAHKMSVIIEQAPIDENSLEFSNTYKP